MSSILFIRPQQTPPEQADWLLYNTANSTCVEQGVVSTSGPANDGALITALRQRAAHAMVILLIPGQHVRWFNQAMPNKQRALINSLPFMIEEQISTPIEQIHVAPGHYHAGFITGLATPHEIMQSWIDWLDAISIEPSIITADFELLTHTISTDAAASTIVQIDQQRLIHSTTIHASVSQTTYEALTTHLTSEGEPLSEPAVLSSSEFLEYCAQRFSLKHLPINLLCNQYQAQHAAKKWLSTFKLPLFATAALLLIAFIGLIVDNTQMQRQVDQLDNAMKTVYQTAFPDAKRISNPVSQMRGALKQLSQGGNGALFIEWLATAAPHLKQDGVSVQNLRFSQSPDLLRLQLQAKDYATIEKVNSAIVQAGLQADLGTLTRGQDNVSGLLTIKAP